MEELKIGDKVQYKDLPGNVGFIINIDKTKYIDQKGYIEIQILHHKTLSPGKRTYWYYTHCVLIENTNLCNCSLETLMKNGCKCGGK